MSWPVVVTIVLLLANAFFVGAEFESGDERYTWLNALHLFGKGGVADGGVQYEFFQGS